MRKNNYFGLIAMSMGLGFITLVACSKDDGCETKAYYLDKDMDNYGITRPTMACKPPVATVGQYVTQSGDTNDNDPNINPGCDLVFYLDEDNDGFGVGEPLTFCENPDEDIYTDFDDAFDCDDTDPNINPDVFTIYYPDNDGDGHGDLNGETVSISGCNEIPEGYVANNTDCDDENTKAYPGAEDITYYLDTDGDGYGSDSKFDVLSACDPAPEYNYSLQGGDCNDNDPGINPDILNVTYYEDSDGDGYGDPNGATTLGSACVSPTGYADNNMDCNDSDVNINPGVELTYYRDADDDGYGKDSETLMISTCDSPPALYALEGGDCNDASKGINPGVDEIPNNQVDENCDGVIE
ncbi:MopE-related protein [Muricauda sp. MAR_2010_75]|jgi:hypothetical protein|uniref:MopE-related protein n=1 Tax=Allomuricauda sp. MAR_2010_75 TaxID=1250232 RepID=UPI00056D117D|nr:MopE-related protein [Muricauda sp. MAR_2010_75]